MALMILAGLSACQSTGKKTALSPDGVLQLNNFQWNLVEINGRAFSKTEAQSQPHLIFLESEQRVAGSTGCNRIMGGYDLQPDGSLKIGNLATTMMACPDMAAETAFLKALNEFGTTRQENGALLFLDDDGHTTVRLVATEPSDTAAD